jgi:hypothetical protein
MTAVAISRIPRPAGSHLDLQRPQVPFSGSWLTDMIGSRRHWAVDSRFGGDLMGRISLRDIDNSSKQARLGITFRRLMWGVGSVPKP